MLAQEWRLKHECRETGSFILSTYPMPAGCSSRGLHLGYHRTVRYCGNGEIHTVSFRSSNKPKKVSARHAV